MAVRTYRLLATCRLFEKLGLPGSASTTSRFRWVYGPGQKGDQPHRCLSGCMPVLFSPHQSLCPSVIGPITVPQRHATWYTDKRISRNLGAVGVGEVAPDFTPLTDLTEGQELADKVNCSVEQGREGRLFAVVAIENQQRKVTVEDILVIDTEFPPTVGDHIRLEKVLMVGGKEFSLIGQPILSREQVCVEATVIEKTLSHNKVWSTYRKRKRYRKMKLFRVPHTVLVINRIELGPVPEA